MQILTPANSEEKKQTIRMIKANSQSRNVQLFYENPHVVFLAMRFTTITSVVLVKSSMHVKYQVGISCFLISHAGKRK